MRLHSLPYTMTLAWLGGLGCAARPVTTVRGIELDDPNDPIERATAEPAAGAAAGPHSALVASGTEQPAAPPEHDDHRFVYSREPMSEQARLVAMLPIHIHGSWWTFRAQQLGITEAQAQTRDAQLSQSRAPADFWDSQTAVEAVSVWTVLCNECHGGRRSLEDALEMPEPAPTWGNGEGVFFGKQRTYKEIFNIVYNGGPVRESGRAEMPAWRRVLSTEMIWALLYFLERQSASIDSPLAPSLSPRRPKVLGDR